jgi:hypothetical protein
MAYTTKYFTAFKNESGKGYQLLIQEDNWSGAVTELESGVAPISIVSSSSGLLDTVVGSGVEIELISKTSLQLVGLYSIDPFQYKVVLVTSDGFKQWQGWLNTETYEENYSEYSNYVVSFTANDGIALLDRYDYIDDNEEPYEGIESAFAILQRCFSKVSAFDKFHIGHTMTILDNDNNAITPGTYETFLHYIYLNNANYYDETGKAISMRTLVESILKPLGLILRTNSSLYGNYSDTQIGYTIFDNNVVLSTQNEYFTGYNTSDGSYAQLWQLYGAYFRYDLGTTIDYKGTGSTLSYTDVINRQEVTFSPYNIIDILKAEFKEEDFCGYGCPNYTGETQYSTSCANDQQWSEWHYDTHPDFTMISSDSKLTEEVYGIAGVSTVVSPGRDYYIRTDAATGANTDIKFSTNVDTPALWGHWNELNSDFNSWALLVNFDVALSTKHCWDSDNLNISNYYITIKIEIGTASTLAYAKIVSDRDTNGTYKYLNTNTYYSPSVVLDDYTAKGDGVLAPLDMFGLNTLINNGKVKISITAENTAGSSAHFRFKNFTVKLVQDTSISASKQSYYDIYDSDKVYESNINLKARDEGDNIFLIHGTHTNARSLERGVLMYEDPNHADSYRYLWKFDKGLKNDANIPLYFNAEEWLINKILSNYKENRVKLSNIIVKASSMSSNALSRFTDNANLLNKTMMINSYSYDIYADTVTLELMEINKDSMDIIKE